MRKLKKIGFIGTGIMGAAMAGHLMDAGFEVSVYNRTKAKAEKLIERGARWCETAGECAKNQDVVISIVGYPKDVEQVYLAEGGIIDSADAETFLIDMTTSSPVIAEKIYNAAKSKNLYAVDAPVTGGDTGAKNATLTIFVGGDEESFDALKPVFEVLGKNIVYEGTAGAGQKTKIANQIALSGALAGAAEAFAYAKAAGLDIEKVYAAISKGSAGSVQMTDILSRGLLHNDFNPGFMVKHLAKDLAIGVETATNYGQALPILGIVLHELRNLEKDGKGSEGTQSLLKYYGISD